MTEELDVKRVCMMVRPGIEIWLEESKAEEVKEYLLSNNASRFIKIEKRMVNIADISGIFEPKDLEEYTRRQRGQWKCKWSNWHNKTEHCECGRF